MPMNTLTVRAFDFVRQDKPADGHIVLLDRVWPRGLRKDELGVDEWARHLAPSSALRKWLHQDTGRWHEFIEHYRDELRPHAHEVERLARVALNCPLVLLYGEKDRRHNSARGFQHILETNGVVQANGTQP
jgi:uncharacterized protein YeaO (DUF488 family)